MSEKISSLELLDELKRIKKTLGRNPTKRELSEFSKYSKNAYVRAFGCLNNAYKLMGEKPNMEFGHTKEEVVSEMKKLQMQLGRIPTITEFSEMSSMSYRTARNLYDGMGWKALCDLIAKEPENVS